MLPEFKPPGSANAADHGEGKNGCPPRGCLVDDVGPKERRLFAYQALGDDVKVASFSPACRRLPVPWLSSWGSRP